jgi:hypothetical protein
LNYNDDKFGGDEHNASYVALMGIRRFWFDLIWLDLTWYIL